MDDFQILDSTHFSINQARSYCVPGYLIVECKTGRTHLGELDAAGEQDLLNCLAEAERLVREIIAPERIYVLKFGEADAKLHFHVVPRTDRIARAYLAEVDDEAPYRGAAIVDWIWRRHESLGFSKEEIAEFVDEARRANG